MNAHFPPAEQTPVIAVIALLSRLEVIDKWRVYFHIKGRPFPTTWNRKEFFEVSSDNHYVYYIRMFDDE